MTSENGLEWVTKDGTTTTVSPPSSLRLSIPENFTVKNYAESMIQLMNPNLPDHIRKQIPEELVSRIEKDAAQPTPEIKTWRIGRQALTLMPDFPHDAARMKYFTEAFEFLIDKEAVNLADDLKLDEDRVRRDLDLVKLNLQTWWQSLVRRG